MNYRESVILSQESIATAGTKTLDITIKDPITRIGIQVKATNNGSDPTAHPAAIISSIELVDGSDVLFSLDGYEALAHEFFTTGKAPFVINNYLDDVMNVAFYNIFFGRYLYDEQLALDPTKFRNPQLKITHNISSGGASPDAGTLEVIADVFDDKRPEPIGFLTTKELVSYTLAASGNEYIDLPTDYPIRNIMIQSLSAGKQPWEQYNEIKLSEDNDKRVPINDKTSDLIKYMTQRFGRITEYLVGAAGTSSNNFYIMSTYEVAAALTATDETDAYLTSDLSYGGQLPITASASTNFMGVIQGSCPFGALLMETGKPDVIEDWYDVTKVGSLRLTIKAGSSPGSNSTCQVITQQLRAYPSA